MQFNGIRFLNSEKVKKKVFSWSVTVFVPADTVSVSPSGTQLVADNDFVPLILRIQKVLCVCSASLIPPSGNVNMNQLDLVRF